MSDSPRSLMQSPLHVSLAVAYGLLGPLRTGPRLSTFGARLEALHAPGATHG